jgi:hypothetical protein
VVPTVVMSGEWYGGAKPNSIRKVAKWGK